MKTNETIRLSFKKTSPRKPLPHKTALTLNNGLYDFYINNLPPIRKLIEQKSILQYRIIQNTPCVIRNPTHSRSGPPFLRPHHKMKTTCLISTHLIGTVGGNGSPALVGHEQVEDEAYRIALASCHNSTID